MTDEETLWLRPLVRAMQYQEFDRRNMITLGMTQDSRPAVYNLRGDNRFVGVDENLDDLVIKSHLASLAANTDARFVLTEEFAHFAEALPGRSMVVDDALEGLEKYGASDKVVVVAEQSHRGFGDLVSLVQRNKQWAIFGMGFTRKSWGTYLLPGKDSTVGIMCGGKRNFYDPALLRDGETCRDLLTR